MIAIVQLGLGFYVTSLFFIEKEFAEIRSFPHNVAIILYIVTGESADIGLTATLSYYLREIQSKTEFGRTDKMLRLLTIWGLNSGLTMAIAAIVVMIAFLASPNTLLFLTIHLLVSKVYTNW